MKKLVIIGAGGHGAVAADIAALQGYTQICFLDDGAERAPEGYLLAGTVSDYPIFRDDSEFFVAIGNCGVRERIQRMLVEGGAKMATLIHPQAVIGSRVEIGAGSVIMAGAVVNTGARLAEGVILNTCGSVDHDCTIGSFSHVAVGAHVCGTVSVGERTWIGAGATVINNISVCSDCIIGAGAVVVAAIDIAGTYLGVPAQKKNSGTVSEMFEL